MTGAVGTITAVLKPPSSCPEEVGDAMVNSVDAGSTERFLDPVEQAYHDSLQEERRRTGRYLAAGLVIFLVILGLYHAVRFGSTRLSALLGAALIMFLYLLWLLYASHRKKRIVRARELAIEQQVQEVIIHTAKSKEKISKPKQKLRKHRPTVCRSYSIG
ncbi:unnamed protein product [Callosobruchus maculatus]|uniref:Uncharacterized protein n=1 Tax=Callosobruchus maculatus TaxID=64391 RepID=A0A653BZR4_CALMS|nr:unnamed protein product [Callosobruchus maculatus]